MSKKVTKQKIKGSHNIINNGEIIKTEKVIKRTVVEYNNEIHISDFQASQIKNRVQEIAQSISQKENVSNRQAYGREYMALYKKFGITSYKLLPKDKFDEAIKWLQRRMRYTGHKVDRSLNKEAYRNRNYKGIYARSKQLGMSKEDILTFAERELNLKKPISSLKELSDTRLQKLYTKIFSRKW